MSTKLRDLFVLDDEKELEASPPPLPAVETSSSSSNDPSDEQGSKEKMRFSPEKDTTPEELRYISEVSFAREKGGTADLSDDLKRSDILTAQAECQLLEKSLKKEDSKSHETSPGYIVLEGPEIIDKRTVFVEAEVSKSFDEPPYFSDTESFRTAEKALYYSYQESSKSGEISSDFTKKGMLESTEKPSGFFEQKRLKSNETCPGKGEVSKAKESSAASATEMTEVKQVEKAKKTVKLHNNEIADDILQGVIKSNASSIKSLGMNLDALDLNISPGSGHQVSPESGAMVEEAWERLNKSYVYYKGKPVGTLAAMDPSAEALNYNQVFVRDFVPSGLACLMKHPSESEIVKNFLLKTLHLQGWEKRIDNFTLGKGVMPASFKVLYNSHRGKDILVADFGGSAIGRVAPVDSGFWWIIMLRSYTKSTHDYALAELPEVQKGMKLILNLCLSDGFDTFPTLLCADGCSMIDRRMGIYGYPIEIQALFYFALRCARQMLKPERDGKELLERIDKRIKALSYHIQKYYWLDFTQLNNIYRYKTEEYSHTAVNKFNVIPESIPDWVFDFMPLRGGYLIGNVSPARMDFRWFLVGNCIAILSSLVTPAQATAIMDLVEEQWEDLIGEMPLKITYPALEGHEWRTVTGYDPKNTRWSYHNGGSWPVLLWLLAAACIKVGRPQIAKRAIELVEQRLSKEGWPEYYDGKTGRYVGKQARKYQTWSISGYLVAKMMIENPANLAIISLEEDKKIAKPLARSASF